MKKRKKFTKIAKIGLPILFTLIIVLILFIGYKLITKDPNKTFLEKLEMDTYAHITNYAIYGIHMNIEGEFTLPDNVQNPKLLLANDSIKIEIPWELKEDNNTYTFKTSNFINEGINLENIPVADLYLVIETESTENNKNLKYYSVENHSKYENMEYYTLTKNHKNNKITMEWNTFEECPTWRFQVKETTLPENVYDITIDPGHDGTDPGKTICLLSNDLYDADDIFGCYNGGNIVEEREINLNVSLALKQKLEDLGYKVAITRTDNKSRVEIYEPMGSATMANDTKSKFSLAIHSNSSGVPGGDSSLSGLEVYVAGDINFDLAELFVSEISSNANITPSTKIKYQVANGIYQRFFTQEEIDNDDYPETKSLDLIYYYYIREVGGVSTHAINNGYSEYHINEHYNSNNTAEPYLFELGYVDNLIEVNNLINNADGYAEGFVQAIQKYLEQER